MSDAATTEEVRHLRTAVASLTKLTFALTRLLIANGIAPDLETKRLAASLRTGVLDDELREGWDQEVEATNNTAAKAPGSSVPVTRRTIVYEN